MRIAVVGSRSFHDYWFLKRILDKHIVEMKDTVISIVSGGADGADSLARRYAREHNIDLQEFLPDWDRYGKSAGPIRNRQIVDASDVVIAFWDGKSRGTSNTVNMAKKDKKTVHIHWSDHDPRQKWNMGKMRGV